MSENKCKDGKSAKFSSPSKVKKKAIMSPKKENSPKLFKFQSIKDELTIEANQEISNHDIFKSELIQSAEEQSDNHIMDSKMSNDLEYIGLEIKNLNDLKKVTPQIKLSSSKMSSPSTLSSSYILNDSQNKLHNYCRTCAELKFPLIDIFSDEGTEMQLNEQLQYFEEVDEFSLSTKMCIECIKNLETSYKFLMQIKNAEVKLQSIWDSCPESQVNDLEEDYSEHYLNEENESSESFFDQTETFEESNENISYDECEPDDSNDIDQSLQSNYDNSETENCEYNFDESQRTDDNETNIKNESEKIFNNEKSSPMKNSIPPSQIFSDVKKNVEKDVSFANADNGNEKNKLILALKEMKIPKLNFDDVINVEEGENGIMYVTTKGSKPNELLLLKVKKMEKLTKKDEKGKKSSKTHSQNKAQHLRPSNLSENNIDDEIEKYKRKRVEILGEGADMIVEEEPSEVIDNRGFAGNLGDTGCTENTKTIKEELEDADDPLFQAASTSTSSSASTIAVSKSSSSMDELRERYNAIRKQNDFFERELSTEFKDRLKRILRQKNEYIEDFVKYLNQRKIVASRLKTEDIILLYEKKNNVKIDRSAIEDEGPPEEVAEEKLNEDKEAYDCDFCFRFFYSVDMLQEHAKIHDVRIQYLCSDCGVEFSTGKARREHNATCVQKLICKGCGELQESKGKKRQHEQKHCDESYGQLCDTCGEKFKHQGTLDQHIKVKHMDLGKVHKCPECSKEFTFKTKMTFHMKTVHTTVRAFLCEDCGKDFKNPASLRHHKVRKHLEPNSRKECKICKKMIPAYGMSKHMHTHKAYTIACPRCDKMFKNTSTLKQHLRIHEDQRPYKCNECGVGFNRRDGLRLHMRVHQKSNSRGLRECICQVCGEKFPNHSTLVIHRNRTHKDGRTFTCHLCNRSMISQRSLDWHLSSIHNEVLPERPEKEESAVDTETKRVACLKCNKTFKTETILRTHVKNSHTEKKPQKCLDCDEIFTSDVRLRHHMMVQHERLEGTQKCPFCPKRFVNQLRLKTHMIAHSEERPFACDQCDFMLKTRIQLIKHKQNRHSDERPLQCHYCSWRCKQVSALVCHERTHTNERPYSCSVCKQRFKYLGDKNKHERRHESLGGSGFKRIAIGKSGTGGGSGEKTEDQSGFDSDADAAETHDEKQDGTVYNLNDEIDTFDESRIIKFETGEIVAESEATFEPMYVEEAEHDNNHGTVVVGFEDATVYTEEVSTVPMETEIITNDMIDQQILQPGTVVHLQQQDSNGKIQVIPVMLSLPDLGDPGEVSLTATSIMYKE
ncbi:uncharacterized protein LOC106651891 [Trichogramma pretiosum]|uniref:uncharacterized protein LOC106651891 n=1 Tax=Trichogramma pretiosum TaxID=7493 RepID=UPI0006C93C1D|nr:uncharacterized protein LOC106651891 [Trichogramma pretiosum]XP_023315245.1 uncharacterized protein LOC106651891 [Trichogramma pretiosum]